MSRNAYIFPGQGAQYPGMGKDFATSFSVAREVFQEADELLGEHLSRIIFEGPEDLLTQTRYSQLGIFVVSVAILRTIETQFHEYRPLVCSGLSLGEYTALYASGRLTFQDTLKLVRERSRLMNEACETTSGAMAAVLGLEAQDIEKALQGCLGIWIANYNCPGQTVVSGTKEGVEKAAVLLKAVGAKRVLPLTVHGAFHSGLMQSAQEGLAPFIYAAPIRESQVAFVMNVPGDFVNSTDKIRQYLTNQVTHSVRWEQGIRSMMAFRGVDEQDTNIVVDSEESKPVDRTIVGIERFLEIGCGKTLAGLNKKIGVPVPTLSIDKVEDLERIGETLCSRC